MAHDQDVEVTFGTGRLLGLFFALVVVCAIFFVLGYSLGRSAAPLSSVAAAEPIANADKPKAGTGTAAQPPDTPQSSELTFYKAVEQNDANPQLEQPTEPAAPKAPEVAKPLTGYVVQVAAVSKQEDAQALANALRRKNYNVAITGNPPLDKLYHVQLGPFAEIKDAEAVRARLNADGYNPIVKK
jgi:cell division septation protein DedD